MPSHIHRFYLCAGNHTVAYLGIREVECIMEDLDLFNLLFVRSIVYAGLYEIVQIYFCKCLVGTIVVDLLS